MDSLDTRARSERSTLSVGTGTGLVSRGRSGVRVAECGVQKTSGSPTSFLIVTTDAIASRYHRGM